MKYMFIRTEVEVDANANCIKDFAITPIETIDANSEGEAMAVVMRKYYNLLASGSGDGKTMYMLSQEGKTINWRRYNG